MKDFIDSIKKIISTFPKWLKYCVIISISICVGFVSFGTLVSCEVDYENEGTKIHVVPNSSDSQLENLPSYSDIISCRSYSEVASLVKAYGFNSPEDFEVYLRDNSYLSLSDDFHNFVKNL